MTPVRTTVDDDPTDPAGRVYRSSPDGELRVRTREFWQSINQRVKLFAASMWLVGVVALAAGMVGDARHWWSSQPFLTNVVSSLTGFLFGVPFALVVLSRLTSVQRDHVSRGQVLQRSLDVVSRLRGLASRIRVVQGLPIPALPTTGEVYAADRAGQIDALSKTVVDALVQLDRGISALRIDLRLVTEMNELWAAYKERFGVELTASGLPRIPGGLSANLDESIRSVLAVEAQISSIDVWPVIADLRHQRAEAATAIRLATQNLPDLPAKLLAAEAPFVDLPYDLATLLLDLRDRIAAAVGEAGPWISFIESAVAVMTDVAKHHERLRTEVRRIADAFGRA